MRTFQFKLYRADKNSNLHKQINCAGLTYNHCIALHKRYYKMFGKYLLKGKLQKHLTKLKKISKFSYLKKFGSQAVRFAVTVAKNILKFGLGQIESDINISQCGIEGSLSPKEVEKV